MKPTWGLVAAMVACVGCSRPETPAPERPPVDAVQATTPTPQQLSLLYGAELDNLRRLQLQLNEHRERTSSHYAREADNVLGLDKAVRLLAEPRAVTGSPKSDIEQKLEDKLRSAEQALRELKQKHGAEIADLEAKIAEQNAKVTAIEQARNAKP